MSRKTKIMSENLKEEIAKELEKWSKIADKQNVSLFKKLSSKNKKETVEEEPKTKLCPYCLSEIPFKATKCAHCTSKIDE